MEQIKYKLETPAGAVWIFDNLEDARCSQYIFKGKITPVIANEDELFIKQYADCKVRRDNMTVKTIIYAISEYYEVSLVEAKAMYRAREIEDEYDQCIEWYLDIQAENYSEEY